MINFFDAFGGKFPQCYILQHKLGKKKSIYQMIKNQLLADNQQRKSDQLSDDQIQLNIEEPLKKQMTAHVDFDIKYEQDQRKIVLYIELDPKNIVNLTKQANKGKVFENDQRKRFKNCIFLKKIQTPQTKLKGNFRIHFLHYKGLTFYLQFIKAKKNGEQDFEQNELPQVYSKMKIHYKNQQKWETKWLNAQKDEHTQSLEYIFQLGPSDVEKVLKEKLLLQIFFDKYPKISKDYLGIQNEGNTCYANSTLQVLYHFLPLRKMILQIPSKKLKKLTKCMQQIFVDLMTSENAVRAEQLLKIFQKSDAAVYRQQDIHQFLINFLQKLQAELPQVSEFWTGRDYEFTSSKQFNYQSKQQQNFTQLQLFMIDNKGWNLKSVQESLKQLLQEDLADQPIDTDQFGKIKVYKSRQFEMMPTLLFLNIKRYEYNPKRRQLKKINLDMEYPKQMNLDFLLKTREGLDYILYAVIVHKGRSPSSGHYFCFLNLSKDVNKSDWYEFNDSTVRKIKEQKVLNNFTGKKKKQVYLDEHYAKWAEREEVSEQTAYLLAYIRKDHFQQYQNVQAKVPTWQIERLQQKLTLEQFKTMVPVRIFVLQTQFQFRPFDQSYELQQFKLLKDQQFEQQIKKLQKVLSVKVGTIWKVNCKTQTIKHVHKDYGEECRITVGRHTQQKQSIRQPDYFMIVPEQKMKAAGDYHKRKLGILHTSHLTESENIETVQVLIKQDISAKLQQLISSGLNLQFCGDDLQVFVHGWNSYLHVKIS